MTKSFYHNKTGRHYNTGKSNPMSGKQMNFSLEHNMKLSEIAKQRIGDKNSNWKIISHSKTINGIHRYVERRLIKPNKCPNCCRKVKLELCNIRPDINSETYNTDLKNWLWQCYRCHMKSDGRMYNNLWNQKP